MQKQVRVGASSDVQWISKLLQEGASGGHFSPTLGIQAAGLLRETLANGGYGMQRARGGVISTVFVSSQLNVIDVDGHPAAFLLSLIDKDEVELHLAGTLRDYRRQGCFTELSKAVMLQHATKRRFFARCYKKSTWAKASLAKLGFVIAAHGEPVELALIP